jgi:hypothetical protein
LKQRIIIFLLNLRSKSLPTEKHIEDLIIAFGERCVRDTQRQDLVERSTGAIGEKTD